MNRFALILLYHLTFPFLFIFMFIANLPILIIGCPLPLILKGNHKIILKLLKKLLSLDLTLLSNGILNLQVNQTGCDIVQWLRWILLMCGELEEEIGAKVVLLDGERGTCEVSSGK